MSRKPKIALVSIGHAVYFPQFPGLREELMQKSAAFRPYLEGGRCEVLDFGYVDTVDGAIASVQEVVRADVDGLFIILSTYVPSSVAAPYALYLSVPQVLVAIQPLDRLDYGNTTTYTQLVNDDVCALPEIAGAYRRLRGYMPEMIVAAAGQKEAIQARVDALVGAIAAKAAFKYAKIGYLGHTYEGMYDMHTDPTAFTAQFGAHVQMLEMCELVKRADAVTDADIQRRVDDIEGIFDIQTPSHDPLTDYVQREDLFWSARLSVALDGLIEDHNLSALAYYYKGEDNNRYEQVGAGLIIGNTLLTSRGIPLAGEADLKTAAAMLIMKCIGGGGSFAEIHPFDVCDDVVLVGHDGPHNIAISEGKPILRKLKKYHGKAGSGIGVEFSLKAGPITMLSMSVGADGRFKLVAAAGESIRGAIPQTGNTNTRMKFPMPVTTFLRRWSEAAPTHHFALGTGNRLAEIRLFARMTGLALEVVE